MSKKGEIRIRDNSGIEREAINAVRCFFEGNECVFQEIDQQNDYGKDAYVDITESGSFAGLCVALQIKGGKSYRSNRGYCIPIDNHFYVWRDSSIPVFGIVYDPDDQKMRWCNITDTLKNMKSDDMSNIVLDNNNVLTKSVLIEEIIPYMKVRDGGKENLMQQLFSSVENRRMSALLDCYANGRSDPRYLILLRYLLVEFSDNTLKLAIDLLSHLTMNPDIFYTDKNWISSDIKDVLEKHFVWCKKEIVYLLAEIDWSNWERGNVGQSLYYILDKDNDIKCKIEQIAYEEINNMNVNVAFTAFYLTIYWAGEKGIQKFNEMIKENELFLSMSLINEIEVILLDCGCLGLFN